MYVNIVTNTKSKNHKKKKVYGVANMDWLQDKSLKIRESNCGESEWLVICLFYIE